MKEIVAAHNAFADDLRACGAYVAGAGLEASSAATVVHRNGPDTVSAITDGPYAESREQIGGLYLVECADLDEALDVARRIPYSPGLRVEVRPAPH